jgi:Learning-associated protein.
MKFELLTNLEFFAVVDSKTIQADTEDVPKENIVLEENDGAGKELMDVDAVKQKYNKKTLRDEHGNYPVWMSRREVKRRATGNRKIKQKQKRKRLRVKQKNKH